MKKLIVIILSVLLLAACTPKTPEDNVQQTPDASSGATVTPIADSKASLSFSAVDQNGNAFTEADFEGNQIVLLNFWATWCGPCIGELPYLEKLYESYKDKGLLVVGVLVDGTVDDAKDLITSNGVTYPVIVADGDLLTMASGFMYVPTTVFVNANGERLGDDIVGANSFEDWVQKVEALLK